MVSLKRGALQPRLAGVGFDPLVENMNRVAASEKRPKIRYEAAFVGCHDYDALFPAGQRRVRVDPYLRTSAVAAQAKHQFDFVARVFNESDDVRWATRTTTLDDYFPRGSSIDFLKIDTDGSDYPVLLGGDRLLSDGAVLGIVVEAQFQGWPHDYANVFANIDRYLRARGFALYDLDTNRYTRAALPGLFVYDIPAHTLTGQALWADALYFRDLAHPDYQATWRYPVTRERLLKLVALLDFFGLPDCAAEMLLTHPSQTTTAERSRLLDLLVMSAGFSETYDDHLRRFDSDIEDFYPRTYGTDPTVLTPERHITLLQEENEVLKEAKKFLKRRLRAYKQKLAKERELRERLKVRLRDRQTKGR